MGQGISKIPDYVNEEEFSSMAKKYAADRLPSSSIPVDVSSIFHGLCTTDGTISRDSLLNICKASDVYLSHEWGYTADGRSVHDRVKQVNKSLQNAGLLTWFDEDREKEHGSEQMSSGEIRVEAIENTQVVLVFITERYVELLSSGGYDPLRPAIQEHDVQVDIAAAASARTRKFSALDTPVAAAASAGEGGDDSCSSSTSASISDAAGISSKENAKATATARKGKEGINTKMSSTLHALDSSLTRTVNTGTFRGIGPDKIEETDISIVHSTPFTGLRCGVQGKKGDPALEALSLAHEEEKLLPESHRPAAAAAARLKYGADGSIYSALSMALAIEEQERQLDATEGTGAGTCEMGDTVAAQAGMQKTRLELGLGEGSLASIETAVTLAQALDTRIHPAPTFAYQVAMPGIEGGGDVSVPVSTNSSSKDKAIKQQQQQLQQVSKNKKKSKNKIASQPKSIKRPKFFKCIVPIILEKSMRDPESWGPILGPLLKARLKFDLSEFTDCTVDEYGCDTVSGMSSVSNKMKIEMMQKELQGVVSFIKAAVSGPLLSGGPFKSIKNENIYSLKNIHFRWLKEKCSFSNHICDVYSTIFAKHKYESMSKLLHVLEKDTGKAYFKQVLHIDNEEHIAVIYKELRSELAAYTLPKAQNNIDSILLQMAANEKLLKKTEIEEKMVQKEWVETFLEDEAMRGK